MHSVVGLDIAVGSWKIRSLWDEIPFGVVTEGYLPGESYVWKDDDEV